MDLEEARKKLELALGEDLKKQYFAYLRQLLLFVPTLTKDEFDEKVRSLLHNANEIQCHNNFLLALFNKACLSSKPKLSKQVNNKGAFEVPDYAGYVSSKNPNGSVPPHFTIYPTAASELFVPNSGFINCRINIVVWECGMEGAGSEVTQLVVHACQTFLKNIITAMITKAKGYKIRDRKFQYGFNLPIPDPYIRNTSNISDDSNDSNVILYEDLILPKSRNSLERTTNEMAFAFAASKKRKTGVTLDTKLLYETIRDNPRLLGQHGIHSVQTLKLGLHKDKDEELSSDTEEDSDY